MTLRTVARRALPAWLVRAVVRWSGRPVGVVLVYHRIGTAPGDPRRELVPALARETFRRHVRHLRRRYRVVPAETMPEVVAKRRRWQRLPVAITFDDDLPSHLEHAAPVLGEEGVSATFFLTGAGLDGPYAFWWERLQRAHDRGLALRGALEPLGFSPPAPGGSLHPLGQEVEEAPPEQRTALSERLLALLGGADEPEDGLRRGQVRELVALGHRVAFHTRRHEPLPALDDDALERAMRDGRHELEEVSGQACDVIAYPHGRADARVAAAARRSGISLGFTTSGQPVMPPADPLLVGRLETFETRSGRFARIVAGRCWHGARTGSER